MKIHPRRLTGGVACALSLLVLSGCGANSVTSLIKADPVAFVVNVPDRATGVPVSRLISVRAQHGTLTEVALTAAAGTIPGELHNGHWGARERLEPATTYTLRLTGRNEDGDLRTQQQTFTTRTLSLDEQSYPSVAPLEGETVGVGMPVIVYFDRPIENKALFEQHMHVTAEPATEGSWNWLSATEAHWRPKSYWAAGTKVQVMLDVNGLPAGGGIYGQQDQDIDFTIGRSAIYAVDVAKHTMAVQFDGKVARTIPVTTGDAKHQTREGTKVIMELHPSIDMDALTTGVEVGAPGYYNIKDVRWAMRLTNSGEFIHAAPWSVGSQGRANVSHGCTGMSMANAHWLFSQSRRGDVVTYVNSTRPLEQGNGWTDWDVPWADWLAGSALSAATPN